MYFIGADYMKASLWLHAWFVLLMGGRLWNRVVMSINQIAGDGKYDIINLLVIESPGIWFVRGCVRIWIRRKKHPVILSFYAV